MPALRQASRSPVIASAVSATIGRWAPLFCSRARIAWVVSNPPIFGMCTSISTTSKRSLSSTRSASSPSPATLTWWPRFESMVTVIFWFTTLSSTSSTRSGARSADFGAEWGAAGMASTSFDAVEDDDADRFVDPLRICSTTCCRVRNETGLVRNAETPSVRQRAASPACPPEVNIMSVAAARPGSFWMRSASSMPSIPGMW